MLVALVFGAVIGVLYLGVTKSLKKSEMKKQVPFGPHLATGIVLSLYFADPLLNWYIGLWS